MGWSKARYALTGSLFCIGLYSSSALAQGFKERFTDMVNRASDALDRANRSLEEENRQSEERARNLEERAQNPPPEQQASPQQGPLGNELPIALLRNVPVYDPESGRVMTLDTRLREITHQIGGSEGSDLERDPVRAGYLMMHDPDYLMNSAHIISDMNGNWLTMQETLNLSPDELRARGLPAENIRAAAERYGEAQQAYRRGDTEQFAALSREFFERVTQQPPQQRHHRKSEGAPPQSYSFAHYLDVKGVKENDTLSVRRGPGVHNPVTFTLPYNQGCIEYLEEYTVVTTTPWIKIKTRSGKIGWVSGLYIKDSSRPCTKLAREPPHYDTQKIAGRFFTIGGVGMVGIGLCYGVYKTIRDRSCNRTG